MKKWLVMVLVCLLAVNSYSQDYYVPLDETKEDLLHNYYYNGKFGATAYQIPVYRPIREKQMSSRNDPVEHQKNYYLKTQELIGESTDIIHLYNAYLNLDAYNEFLKIGIDLRKYSRISLSYLFDDYKYNLLLKQTVIEGTIISVKYSYQTDEKGFPPGTMYTIRIDDLLIDNGLVQPEQRDILLYNMSFKADNGKWAWFTNEAQLNVGDRCIFLLSYQIGYDRRKEKYGTPLYYYADKYNILPVINGNVLLDERKNLLMPATAFKDTARMIYKINDYKNFFQREYK